MESADKEIIFTRLNKLKTELIRLEQHKGVTLEEYLKNDDLQAIIERRLQLAAQITIDIANYLITRKRLEIPEEEENVFMVLFKHDIILEELAYRMKGIVRFRNILVHNYLEIDPEIVYKNFKNNMDDFRNFSKQIAKFIGIP